MPDTTPILSLPLILPAQAQKHVTHNEALLLLDVLAQLVVLDRSRTAPPLSPVEGDVHIVAAGATGDWAGQSGRLATWWQGGWTFLAPRDGWRAWDLDQDAEVVFEAGQWLDASARPLRVDRLGVNADADATNRLAVTAPATLLNHAGAGHQLKLNKATPGDTASLLYQTGFSGRAEMGLAGSDDFSVKVSPDGTAWTTAVSINRTTGAVGLPAGAAVTGQITGTAVMQSATDATPGRLMPVGAWGLGAETAVAVSNLNTIAHNGFFEIAAADAATGNAPGGTGAWEVLHIQFDASSAKQIALQAGVTGAVVQLRVKAAGTWQAWQRLDPQAFGLGQTTYADLSPEATDLPTRIFRTNAPIAGFGAGGHTLHMSRAPNAQGAQIAVRDSSDVQVPLAAVRHRSGTGTWSTWNVLFGRLNLLGAVTQTGGVPTGAVIERGSNANGEFVRFADGTLICTRANLSAANASTALGSLFASANIAWTFPATFVAAPVVTGAVDNADCWLAVAVAPTTTSVSVRAIAAVTKASAMTVRAQAIGRWF